MSRSAASRPRWWPLIVIAVGWAGLLAWTQWGGDRTGQERVTQSIGFTAIALLLAVAWLLLLSRLPWRRRLWGFAAVVAVGVALGWSLEIRGVSGNLLPILEWRWSADRGEERGGERGGERALAGPLGDYPQFLGPGRDATLDGPVLARDWSEPPREIWRRPVGDGWSAFAIAGAVAVTQEQRGDEELVTAWELASGRRLWEHADRRRYETTIAGVGPRATPTIADGTVYALGALGTLNALALADGTLRWQRDLEGEYGGATPDWGRSNSPLVVDGLVVVPTGGPRQSALVAFDAATGDEVWRAGDDAISYSSPVVVTLAGRRQIVVFHRASISGHDVATGSRLWSYPWSSAQPNVALPVPIGADRLLVSSGYGEGSQLLEIARAGDRFEVTQVWKSPRLKAKFTNVVEKDGYIYGLDDGVLVCLDPATGERCWKRGRYGHGQVILVDDLLLVTAENGDVVLVEPDPEAHRELGRFTAFDDKTWNPPALAGRYLLVRNHREAALYELPLATG